MGDQLVAPAAGYIGTRPKVGLRPTSPQKLAGMRIEPAPSEPSANGASPAATAAAPPPVDPPGVRVRSQGLRDSPNNGLSVEPRQANSGRLVRPTKIAPAARRRATLGLSSGGTKSARRREPEVVRSPAVQWLSLIERGTPWSGPSGSAAITDCSAWWACFSARSAWTRT